jgi:hypothetical protein
MPERIASARSNPDTTIATLEDLIPKAEAERDRLSDAHIRASADSVDFALSEEDRDEAARNAERYSRNALAIGKAIEELKAKLEAKRESNGRKAAEAERAAAMAERDEIAAEMREFVPEAMSRLTALLSRSNANADRLRAAGMHVRDAEAEARDVLLLGPGVESFAKLKIPAWNGPGRQWPPVANMAVHLPDYGVELERAKQAKARAAAQEEARYGWYRLFNRTGLPVFFESRTNPRAAAEDVDYCGRPWEGQMHHDMARKLAAKPEIEVQPIEAPAETTQ